MVPLDTMRAMNGTVPAYSVAELLANAQATW